MLKPLFKCVGGKTQLASAILAQLPHSPIRVYREPFVGGGSVACALWNDGHIRDAQIYLGDADRDTMAVYSAVRDDAYGLAAALEQTAACYAESTPSRREALYYGYRDAWNNGDHTALRMLTLRAGSFNGLWRYSKRGVMNSSWGKRTKLSLPSRELLLEWQQLLRNATLVTGDFSKCFAPPYPLCATGDVVYFDPPYIGTFVAYTRAGFTIDDQGRLLQLAAECQQRGAHVLMSSMWSDAAVEFAARVWPTATAIQLHTRYRVAARATARRVASELLLVGSANANHVDTRAP